MVATKEKINKELPRNPKKYIMTDMEFWHILNVQAVLIDNLMNYNTRLLTNLANSINNQMTHRETQEERQNEMMNKLINMQVRKNMLDSFSKENDYIPTLLHSSPKTPKEEKEDTNTNNNHASRLQEILDKLLEINNKTKVVEANKGHDQQIDMVQLMNKIKEIDDSRNKQKEEDEPFIPNNDDNYSGVLGNDI